MHQDRGRKRTGPIGQGQQRRQVTGHQQLGLAVRRGQRRRRSRRHQLETVDPARLVDADARVQRHCGKFQSCYAQRMPRDSFIAPAGTTAILAELFRQRLPGSGQLIDVKRGRNLCSEQRVRRGKVLPFQALEQLLCDIFGRCSQRRQQQAQPCQNRLRLHRTPLRFRKQRTG